MKICSKCNIEKPFTEFYKNPALKNGIKSYCKKCQYLHYDSIRNAKLEYKASQSKKGCIKYKNDPIYRLKNNLRRRLRAAIKNNSKVGSAVKDLGCSIEDFRKYIESKFQPGMCWENHGQWHLDHIKPLSSFNLENKEEFSKACNFSNYQPLWAIDNLRKGSKI